MDKLVSRNNIIFMGMDMTETIQSLSFETQFSNSRSLALTFRLNPQMTTTVFHKPDMLLMVSEFGGLMYLLSVVFGMMTSSFGNMYVKAYVSNSLYYFNSSFNIQLFGKSSEPNSAELSALHMEKNKGGSMILSIPSLFGLRYYRWLFCCKRDPKFTNYMRLIKLSGNKLDKDLDLVRFIRRLRMHGAGLYYVLSMQ
jgi:hypothetical protein